MKRTIKAYYRVRSLIPKCVRTRLRQWLMHYQRSRCRNIWPINPAVSTVAPWNSWPEGKKFAVVLTHDVETALGVEQCAQLMGIEEQLGFRSSFDFVPERYTTPTELRQRLKDRGFEVGVHGLLHDGRLYESKSLFMKRAERINHYLKSWGAVGFRSPSMHRNLDWLHELNILYDASTFDVDPFEPDKRALGTIFPAWVPPKEGKSGYIELPYTLPQDSSLFLYLKEKDIRIWKGKTDWIAQHGGMVLINTHPDYMRFSPGSSANCTYPAEYYSQFLEYILTEYEGDYWHALPREIAAFATEHIEQLPIAHS